MLDLEGDKGGIQPIYNVLNSFIHVSLLRASFLRKVVPGYVWRGPTCSMNQTVICNN